MKNNYNTLIQERPHLFENPQDCPYRILLTDEEIQAAETATGLSTGILHEDNFILLVRDAIQWNSGKYGTYIRILHRNPIGGAVILPVTSDGAVVLIRQFRHVDRQWHYEIPRGFAADSDQNLTKNTALRELSEEIHASVTTVEYLGTLYPDTGLLGQPIAFYSAALSSTDQLLPQIDEGISSLKLVSVKELEMMIQTGQIQDGFTVNAYTLAKLKKIL